MAIRKVLLERLLRSRQKINNFFEANMGLHKATWKIFLRTDMQSGYRGKCWAYHNIYVCVLERSFIGLPENVNLRSLWHTEVKVD